MNNEFERLVVKGILAGCDSKYVISKFTSDFFEIIEQSNLYDLILSFYQKFHEVPEADVLVHKIKSIDWMKEAEKINSIAFLEKQEEISESKFKYAIEQVEKNFISRKIRISMKEALKYLEAGNPFKAQEILSEESIDVQSSGKEIRVLDFSGNFENRKNELIKRKNNPELLKEYCIPTGIEKLDIELDGGIRKGELLLWLGVPSGGKSISMQDCSISMVEKGFKVMFFTIEMTPEQTAYRMDSRLSQIQYRQFRRNNLTDEEIKQWERCIKKIPENILKIISVPEGCNCLLIEAEIQKIKSNFVPDIIIIDYVGIMSPNEGRFQSNMSWEYIGTIVKNLKGLALKMNVPVMSASQILVGAKEKASLSFSDIGMARQQIAAHCDICCALIQTSQMQEMDMLKIQIVKIREGSELKEFEVQPDFDKISIVRRTNKPFDVNDKSDFPL